MEVGLLLIHKVRTTIRYKTEDATHVGVNWRIYNFKTNFSSCMFSSLDQRFISGLNCPFSGKTRCPSPQMMDVSAKSNFAGGNMNWEETHTCSPGPIALTLKHFYYNFFFLE